MSLPCMPRDIIYMQQVHIFLLRVSICPKVMTILCLTHDMLQSVIVSGAVIYHISNVNGVLQYIRISAIHCIIPDCIIQV